MLHSFLSRRGLPKLFFIAAYLLSQLSGASAHVSDAAFTRHHRTSGPPEFLQQSATAAAGAVDWKDEFDGTNLDATKWEVFTLEGEAKGAPQISGGQLRETGAAGARTGVRSKNAFNGDRFLVEATIAKVMPAAESAPGESVLAVLFDATGRNRIEWGMSSSNKFEARQVIDGTPQRIEARQAGSALNNAKLGIGRRGDDFFFTVNDQIQFQKTIANLPREFHLALYGANASESNWETAHAVVQSSSAAPQTTASAPSNATTTGGPADGAAANLETWADDFNGPALDKTKWEQYTFEGGAGGKIEVKDGQLRQHGVLESRSGVRSTKSWHSDRFYVEATLANVGERTENSSNPRGYAIVSVLLNGTAQNRIEWVLTSDHQFEAWATTTPNGQLERLDNKKLATREKSPRLGIARRGDQLYFMLNGQIGLQKTVRALSPDFRVMLYGFGSSENDWDSVQVQVPKQ